MKKRALVKVGASGFEFGDCGAGQAQPGSCWGSRCRAGGGGDAVACHDRSGGEGGCAGLTCRAFIGRGVGLSSQAWRGCPPRPCRRGPHAGFTVSCSAGEKKGGAGPAGLLLASVGKPGAEARLRSAERGLPLRQPAHTPARPPLHRPRRYCPPASGLS